MTQEIHNFLNEEYFSEYNYGIPDIVKFNNELAYVISFEQKKHIEEALKTARINSDGGIDLSHYLMSEKFQGLTIYKQQYETTK